jgi:hypothetical protein
MNGQLHAPALYLLCPLDRRLDGPQSRSGRRAIEDMKGSGSQRNEEDIKRENEGRDRK